MPGNFFLATVLKVKLAWALFLFMSIFKTRMTRHTFPMCASYCNSCMIFFNTIKHVFLFSLKDGHTFIDIVKKFSCPSCSQVNAVVLKVSFVDCGAIVIHIGLNVLN